MMKKGLKVLSIAALFSVFSTGFVGCGNKEVQETVITDESEAKEAYTKIFTSVENALKRETIGLRGSVRVNLTEELENLLLSNAEEDDLAETRKILESLKTGASAEFSKGKGYYYLNAVLNDDYKYRAYVTVSDDDTVVYDLQDKTKSHELPEFVQMFGGITGLDEDSIKEVELPNNIKDLEDSLNEGLDDLFKEDGLFGLFGLAGIEASAATKMTQKGDEKSLIININAIAPDFTAKEATEDKVNIGIEMRLIIAGDNFKGVYCNVSYEGSGIIELNVESADINLDLPEATTLAGYREITDNTEE